MIYFDTYNGNFKSVLIAIDKGDLTPIKKTTTWPHLNRNAVKMRYGATTLEAVKAQIISQVPLGKMRTPEDVAKLVVYLILGLLLLSSYLGGAIATYLQHGQDILSCSNRSNCMDYSRIRFTKATQRITGRLINP